MNIHESPLDDSQYRRRLRPRMLMTIGGLLLTGVVVALGVVVAGLHNVAEGEFLVLVNKTGKVVTDYLPDNLALQFADQVVLYPALVRSIAAETSRTED